MIIWRWWSHLRENRCRSLAFLRVWIIEQVWLKCVEFSQLMKSEVPFNLLMIYDSIGQRLLGHLTIVDLLLHGSLVTARPFFKNYLTNNLLTHLFRYILFRSNLYLSQQAVHKHLFQLTEAIHPVYALYVVWRVPRSVKDDDPVSSHKVDPKWSGSRWNQKQSATEIIKQNN